ncbi:hypothetical protein INT43_006485 [Umbelopsis isabellina]|uniref:Polysaccharide lyase 14 domain-containing protein n=1 Tax=Mortierella isabellina TaxID=91625 RepID=A0A8H7PZA3_MORIS|nr:hypothetical protein INT43_006485 [Umbelopsis isabellina]
MSYIWSLPLRQRRNRTTVVAVLAISCVLLYWIGFPSPGSQNVITVSPQDCYRVIAENEDMIPYAACHIQKQTWAPASFVYGFGSQNVHYPASLDSPQPVMKVEYPKNSINPLSGRVGGVGWFTHNVHPSQEMYFQYDVKFQHGFSWVKGGKLPGMYGGRTECSGGNTALDCFSIRLMWRKNGDGEAYLYVPKDEQVPDISKIPPKTEVNPTYGISAGRGAFQFTSGQWDTVGMFVKMNDIGSANGLFKIWVNKKLVIQFDKVVWRTMDIGIDGIQFETFFGGSRPGFEAAEQSFSYFRNVFYATQVPADLPQ